MNIDPRTFRLVAGLLGVAFIVILASMAVLAGFDKDYPGVFDNILTGLLTGLLGLLISARSEDPVDVNVTNTPVETVEAPAGTRRRKRSDSGIGVVGLILVIALVIIVLAAIGAIRGGM